MPEQSRQEIESHSSQLTNLRIANLSKVVMTAEMEANNMMPPTIQHAIAYHYSLLTFYFETSEVYDTEINKQMRDEIEKCLKGGEKIALLLKTKQNPPQHYVEWLIQNSKKWRHLMHKGLQNLKYWFRFGKHDPKGINEILSLFEQSDKKGRGEDETKEKGEDKDNIEEEQNN